MKRTILLLLILGCCGYLLAQNQSPLAQKLQQQSQYLLPKNGANLPGNLDNVQTIGDTLGAFNAGELTGNPFLFGVEFAFDHYWVSGYDEHFNFHSISTRVVFFITKGRWGCR